MRILSFLVLLFVVSSCSLRNKGTAEENSSDDFHAFVGAPRDQDEALRQLEQQLRERDDVIQQCMAEQGFEYSVPDPSDRLAPEPGFDLPVDKYAAEFGFGLSTVYSFGDSIFQESLDEEPISPFGDLSENEIDAFFKALNEPEGCAQEGDKSMEPDPEIAVLLPEVDEMFQRIKADPRIVVIEEDARRCVAENVDLAGSDIDGAVAKIQTDLAFIDERWVAFIDRSFEEVVGDDAFEALGPPMPTDELIAELNVLQEYERQLAVAVYECNEIDIDEYGEIEAEYQAEFLAEHQK